MAEMKEIFVKGRSVKVDRANWDALTPEQKNVTVDEIYSNMVASGAKFGLER